VLQSEVNSADRCRTPVWHRYIAVKPTARMDDALSAFQVGDVCELIVGVTLPSRVPQRTNPRINRRNRYVLASTPARIYRRAVPPPDRSAIVRHRRRRRRRGFAKYRLLPRTTVTVRRRPHVTGPQPPGGRGTCSRAPPVARFLKALPQQH